MTLKGFWRAWHLRFYRGLINIKTRVNQSALLTLIKDTSPPRPRLSSARLLHFVSVFLATSTPPSHRHLPFVPLSCVATANPIFSHYQKFVSLPHGAPCHLWYEFWLVKQSFTLIKYSIFRFPSAKIHAAIVNSPPPWLHSPPVILLKHRVIRRSTRSPRIWLKTSKKKCGKYVLSACKELT